MKTTIKGFVFRHEWRGMLKPSYYFSSYKPTEDETLSIVCEHSFEVEIPDDFNPIPQQVAALQEAKRLARVNLGKELANLDMRIGKLTCLTNEVAA
jgi:hypothetical protein